MLRGGGRNKEAAVEWAAGSKSNSQHDPIIGAGNIGKKQQPLCPPAHRIGRNLHRQSK